MKTDNEKYIDMVNKLKDIGVIPIGFTYEYFVKNKPKSYYNTKIVFRCSECGKEFERTYGNIIKPDRNKVCKECCKRHKKSKIFTLDEVREKIESKGLKLLSENYNGETSDIVVMCSCGKVYITTYASIRNSGRTDGICKCKECAKYYNRNYFRMSFEDVKEYFNKNDCVLLSSKEEYINIFSEFRFIARCGHEHTTTFQSFKNSKHKICKECIKKVNSGKNAYNWNGGYDSESIRFRKTYEFKQWVKSVYKRDNYICQCCYKKGVKLNAHHLNGYNWDIENRTNVDNGITLCEDCHNDFHNMYGRGNNTEAQFKDWISNTYKIKL